MRGIVIGLAALLLSACQQDPYCGAPRGPLPPLPVGAESAAVQAVDRLILSELAAARSAGVVDPAGADRAARRFGLTGAAELVEIASRRCVEDDALSRFAAAGGLSPEAARVYLEARFGAGPCAD